MAIGVQIRFLLLAAAASVLTTGAWAESTDSAQGLQEVVVTAQKVAQRAIDVPVALSAVEGSALANQDLVQVTDYYSRIPGLQVGALPTGANGTAALSLRGITS